ncbi:MAG: ATP-binding cassette domain-containing protein [bacterium]
MSTLTVNNLSFWYHTTEFPTVYRCSFSVAKNEFVAIVGESGGGKSTLLRLVCGLLQAQNRERPELEYRIEGIVEYDGNNILKPHSEFAYVPQNFQAGLLPALSVRDNILLAVKRDGITKDKLEYADALMKLSGIIDVAQFKVGHLSGGQQQRVAICRALITKPCVLFMDEPFANLDPTLKPEMSKLLKHLRDEYSLLLLFVTHDIENATNLADKIVGVKCGYGKPKYKLWIIENNAKRDVLRREIEKWIET